MTTECEEIADSIDKAILPDTLWLDDCRREVRALMPDESAQVVDNIAWALHQRRFIALVVRKLRPSWDHADAAKREVWEAAFQALFSRSLSWLIEESRR